MRNSQLIQSRNRQIANVYCQLDKKGIRDSIIVDSICKAFYLSEYRVRAIIRQLVKAGELRPTKETSASPIQLSLQLQF